MNSDQKAPENTFQLNQEGQQQNEPLIPATEQRSAQPNPRENPPNLHQKMGPVLQPPPYQQQQQHQVSPRSLAANNNDGYRLNPQLANLPSPNYNGQQGYNPPPQYYNQNQRGGQNYSYSYIPEPVFPERPDLLINNVEPMDARPQNPRFPPKQFVLHETLGPYVTPTGPATINIDRLQPYLDYLAYRIPKELESTGYKWYLLWIWLYASLSLVPVALLFTYAITWNYQTGNRDYDFAAIPIQMLGTIHWAGGVYQAYYIQKVLSSPRERKRNLKYALNMMKFYLMGIILMITILIGCMSISVVYKDASITLGLVYFGSFILEAGINYYVAMRIEKHIKKYERFQEIINSKLQDPEKTGIYYRYVYELLELISADEFLYPIRAPRRVDKKIGQQEAIKRLNDALERLPEEHAQHHH